jgi:hypothetical protein
MNPQKQKTEVGISNEQNDQINEEFMIFFHKNLNKINTISKWMNIFKILAILSFFLMVILLAVRLATDFSWCFLLIPSLSSVVCLGVFLNLYLGLINLIEEFESQNKENSSKVGSVLTYMCLNTSALSLSIFMIILAARMDLLIMTNLNILAIPLYFMFGLFFFYGIFILPAFCQNKLYAEITLIFVYLMGTFIFFVLLFLKLDQDVMIGFFYVFLSIIFTLGFHLVYIVINIFAKMRAPTLQEISALFIISLTITAAVLTPIKLDRKLIKMPNWVPPLLLIIGLGLFILEKIISHFREENNHEEKEKKHDIEKNV